MIKKKAKKKAAGKKSAKKSGGKSKKQLNPADVRENIASMVKEEAAEMAHAVIGEGKKGQLATVKYLFEVAEIFPESTDGSQATAEEDSLAKTLLRRLDLPDQPVVRDEEDGPAKTAAGSAPEAEGSGLKVDPVE
jgi:hypothetical protein